LKGKPSLTPGFEMQYSLISSMFIAFKLRYIIKLGPIDHAVDIH
jgi:hypothetical protein